LIRENLLHARFLFSTVRDAMHHPAQEPSTLQDMILPAQ